MLHIDIHEKSIGARKLLSEFEAWIGDDEKVGLIGRNGAGKTTLLRILTGADEDFDGTVEKPKHALLMATEQEHTPSKSGETTVAHISGRLPRFAELHHIIETYPETMGESMHKMGVYSDALTEFSDRGYYDVENTIQALFDAYQLDKTLLEQPFNSLSGGQKRLVELMTIQLSEPSIAILDEPTNHMDYVAKNAFIQWLRNTKTSVIVISHDRDVLSVVDRIIELKDAKAHSFPGNYDAYLSQNAVTTVNQMQAFETTEKRIANIKEQIEYARAKAPGYKGKAAKNPWVVMREKLERELAGIMETHEKPSFWIDRESSAQLRPKVVEKYDKYKAKNIKVKANDIKQQSDRLLQLQGVSLGYDGKALFDPISFSLGSGDRLHIVGRNGAGKTTMVRAIHAAYAGKLPDTLIGRGVIDCASALRLSEYEQEIGPELLDMTLQDAIERIYYDKNIVATEQIVMRTMGNYLFDPIGDRDTKVTQLSGGQKARLQLIRLLAGDPNLLILDEPTNHLDLPSIEELENALKGYNGAVIYISHDEYFGRTLGGEQLRIG
ncbi:MAG TPA: ABC-F family ATP-binding cassette domain-containing protein [Candidatus Saccharimonadales bacterium]|nr:ABC-F family ATP-binding cassette domain-containing protein [Candidatus Saccharimonadales bacterium]